MRTLIEDDKLVCSPDGDPAVFARLRDAIDPRRKWDANRRAFIFPNDAEILARLHATGPTPSPTVEIVRTSTTMLDDVRSKWCGRFQPYEHQVEGTARLLAHRAYLLSWEMGCGKSGSVASALAHQMPRGGCAAASTPDKLTLIVCPKVVTSVWPRELDIHAGLTCTVVRGDAAKRKKIYVAAKGILVSTYELCRQDVKEVAKLRPSIVVCDEVHRIKNSRSKSAKAIREISRYAERRWALSGTPAPNDPLDWYGILVFLGCQYETTWTAFKNRHAIYGGEVAPGVRKVVGHRDLDTLKTVVQRVSHRLKKEDCLDLPPKVFQEIPVELSPGTRKAYDQLRKEAILRLSEHGADVTAANVLTEALRLLQLCGGYVTDDKRQIQPVGENAKLAALLDYLADIPQEPVIVWCAFVHEAVAIAEKLGARVHHGGLRDNDRQEVIQDFVDGRSQYFVTTTASAREGLTFVRTANVFYYSRNYNLTDWLQSIDRAHRPGQTRTVRITSFVGADTVDDKVSKALAQKETLQEMILKEGWEAML
jgi:SNF2 family DNA or RNA helicase